jgi:CBS domain containing-hemolysin-like protein
MPELTSLAMKFFPLYKKIAEADNKPELACKYIKKGIFTPYQNNIDLAIMLTAPITAPLVMGLLTGISALVVGVATVAYVGSLVVGVCALPFNREFAGKTLSFAALAGVTALLATVVTALSALLIAISVPTALAANITRATGPDPKGKKSEKDPDTTSAVSVSSST